MAQKEGVGYHIAHNAWEEGQILIIILYLMTYIYLAHKKCTSKNVRLKK